MTVMTRLLNWPLALAGFGFLLISLLARSANAQVETTHRDPGATISGVVHDSIANTPLVNAIIQLIARDDPAFVRNATSDSLGRFRMNDVPLGHYQLGFFHPVLDSLGVEAPLRDVYVDSYRPVIADVAVPSPTSLRRAVCRVDAARDSGAVILGTVRDARDGSPVAKVVVVGDWIEYSLNRGGMSRRLARRLATTGENGWFALCNVPSSGSVALVASRGADSTGLIEVQVPSEGFVRRELYLGAADTETKISSTSPTPGVAPSTRRIRIGNGHLSGTVTSVVGNRPLANAQVSIVDGPQTRASPSGEWAISNAPAGTRMLEVRALGYYPDRHNVNVVAGAAPLRITLSTLKAVLDTVRIRASRLPNDRNGNGFMQRRRSGAGRYITPEDIVRLPVIVTSDLFRRMPGVRTDGDSIELRGAFTTWCHAAIFIDDHYMSFLTKDDIDDWVHPEHIAGIEVYSEASAPPQYQVGLSGCGSIVIWTK